MIFFNLLLQFKVYIELHENKLDGRIMAQRLMPSTCFIPFFFTIIECITWRLECLPIVPFSYFWMLS